MTITTDNYPGETNYVLKNKCTGTEVLTGCGCGVKHTSYPSAEVCAEAGEMEFKSKEGKWFSYMKGKSVVSVEDLNSKDVFDFIRSYDKFGVFPNNINYKESVGNMLNTYHRPKNVAYDGDDFKGLDDALEHATTETESEDIFVLDTIADKLSGDLLKSNAKMISFITGPESGFSNNERALMAQKKISNYRLGHYILRAETAPLVTLSKLHTLNGENA